MEGKDVILSDDQVSAMTEIWIRTWSHIRHAVNLHNVDKDDPRLRKFPWPHVSRHNALVETMVRAKTLAELKALIAATPKPIIRKLAKTAAMIFLETRRGPLDAPEHIPVDLMTFSENAIISLLKVDDYASPLHMLSPPGGPIPEYAEVWRILPLSPGSFAPTIEREEKARNRAKKRAPPAPVAPWE